MRNDAAAGSTWKDRRISLPPSDSEEAMTAIQAPGSFVDRRKSIPTSFFEKEIANFAARKKGKGFIHCWWSLLSLQHPAEKELLKQQKGFNGRKSSTLPRRFSLSSQKKEVGKAHPHQTQAPRPFHRVHSPQEPYEYDLPSCSTEPADPMPVRPPTVHLTRNGYSHSHALNQMRRDLNSTLHPPGLKTKAWHSNPTSRASSRDPSRHGSRNPSQSPSRPPSGSSIRTAVSGSDHLDIINDDVEDLTFHEVESHTLVISDGENYRRQRAFSIGGGSSGTMEQEDLFPSQPSPPQHTQHPTTHRRRRTHSGVLEKRNGFLSPAVTFEMPTDLDTGTIIKELVQVAEELKMRDLVSCRGVVIGILKGVRVQIQIRKDSHGMCQIEFQWMSGGNLKSYQDICESFIQRAQLLHSI